ELKNEQLDFSRVEGNHSGHNIARILVDTIDRFSIRSKVSLFKMFHNASNNDTAMKEVAKVIDEDGTHWLPGSRRIR
ncbi:hypothetical protein P692DRAFT_20687475, partial [Suillus brevipes Sb2]